MKVSKFQKEIFERYQPKNHKETSDIVILSTIMSIISKKKEETLRILDVGCGGGQLLESFIKMFRIEVYGVDISKKALEMAEKRGYKTFLCDIENEKLSFNNDFFDIIVINDLLEHLIDPDNLLTEIRRILKKDGEFIINVPNISHPFSWFMQIFLDLPPMQSARYKSVHIRDYTLRLLKIVLKINGFKIENVKGTYIYPFNNKISRLIANLFPRFSERIIIISKKSAVLINSTKDVYFDIRELLEYEKI